MEVDIHKSWIPYLEEELDKPYFSDLSNFVKTEYLFLLKTLIRNQIRMVELQRLYFDATNSPSLMPSSVGTTFASKVISANS